MANASPALTQGSASRRLKDKLARLTVTAGGMMVLLALVLIFFYLLMVILPLFKQAEVTRLDTFEYALPGKPVYIGTDHHNRYGYRYSDTGQIDVFSLPDLEEAASLPEAGNKESRGTRAVAGSEMPSTVLSQRMAGNPTGFAMSSGSRNLAAYAEPDGTIVLSKLRFGIRYQNGDRVVEPSIQMLEGPRFPPMASPERMPLALSYAEGDISVVALIGNNLQLARSENGGKFVYSSVVDVNSALEDIEALDETPLIAEKPSVAKGREIDEKAASTGSRELLITPDGRFLYLLDGSELRVYTLSNGDIRLRERLEPELVTGSLPVSIALLSGANSLLITGEDGSVSQWFDVSKDGSRQLENIRTFESGSAKDHRVSLLAVESHRKGFAVASDKGDLALWHTTSEKWRQLSIPELAGTDGLVFSPRSEHLLAVKGEQWQWYRVDNPHPEVSWASLWKKVWYEGYPSPQFVWQSTSADDGFESKMSVVPIAFGTLKVAAYAMLFAIPLAVGGAIYTAYFMSSSMRRYVKPTIEIMEALPTVILGFLAGLWLAPLIEQNLAAVMLLMVAMPLSFIVAAWVWAILPRNLRHRLPKGGHVLLLVPSILLLGYLAFQIGPWLEMSYMGGDSRTFVSDQLGITFDQRNALVVGIAMGFAVIPTIFTIAEDAIFSVPPHLTSGSLALGATHWQTLTGVVLLTASPGIFSAVMMGVGRAVGETMIVLMATGNTPVMDWNIFEGMRTLSANIAVEMPESEVGSSHYRILFLTAFILFVFTFAFNTVAEFVRQQLREKYRAL